MVTLSISKTFFFTIFFLFKFDIFFKNWIEKKHIKMGFSTGQSYKDSNTKVGIIVL